METVVSQICFIPYVYSVLAHFSNTSEERDPGAIIYPFWQTHTEEGGGLQRMQKQTKSYSKEVRGYMHPLISGVSCLLISNWACQSKHSGTTFPIGIIRILDRGDRLQCTLNHDSEGKDRGVQREWMETNRGSGENKNPKIYIYVYIYIYLYIYEVCIHKKK